MFLKKSLENPILVNATRTTLLCAAIGAIAVGCAGPGIHGDKKTTAASSSSAPDWVKDSSYNNQREMVKIFKDDSDSPKFYYIISQAHVDNENLVSSCFNFARANAANELGSSVTQNVSGAVSSTSDSSSDSQYAVSTVQTKTALAGAQILDRYWVQTEAKDHTSQVTCYIVTGIPIKNFNKLKDIAMKKASKTDMDKTTQENAEKSAE
jgi:hypothetical protein